MYWLASQTVKYYFKTSLAYERTAYKDIKIASIGWKFLFLKSMK